VPGAGGATPGSELGPGGATFGAPTPGTAAGDAAGPLGDDEPEATFGGWFVAGAPQAPRTAATAAIRAEVENLTPAR
jgi:hypothetical protein